MNIQYFKSAWGDIKNSPGWFGKLCLLALLNLIPIFGQIVTFGYLYGWAREIAWGTHEPMPKKVFANEDGKFWRRGWFAFVLTFVFSLIPQIIMQIGSYFQTMSVMSYHADMHVVGVSAFGTLGDVLAFVGFALALLIRLPTWIGNMRIAIYDRLSAGFQLGKIWKMLRHDTKGIFKVFGMGLLFDLILGFILSIVLTILVFIVVFVGVTGLMNAGYSVQSIQYMTEAQALSMLVQFISSAGVVGILALVIGVYLAMLMSVFVLMLITRAMGYWTMQFEVPKWRGQDEPLPFERAASAGSYAQPWQTTAQQPPSGFQSPQTGEPFVSGQPPYSAPSQQGAESYGYSQPNVAQQPFSGAPPQQTTTPSSVNAVQPVQAAIPLAAEAAQPTPAVHETFTVDAIESSQDPDAFSTRAEQQSISTPAEPQQVAQDAQSSQSAKLFTAESDAFTEPIDVSGVEGVPSEEASSASEGGDR